MGKVSQTGALDHVGAGGHRALEGIFHAIGFKTPDREERRKRGVASADGGKHLYLMGVMDKPHVLAVGEICAGATKRKQHILRAAAVQLGQGGHGRGSVEYHS